MNQKAEDAISPEEIKEYLAMKADMTMIVTSTARALAGVAAEEGKAERDTVVLLMVAAAGVAYMGGPALQDQFKKSYEICVSRFGQSAEELHAHTEAVIKAKFEN